jgi:hypothetical protein
MGLGRNQILLLMGHSSFGNAAVLRNANFNESANQRTHFDQQA